MSFDTFSIAAMAAELRQSLLNGRVQRVTQINSLTFGFEIFVHPTRHYLTVSAEPQAPRLHLSLDKSRRGAGNDTPLMLVLRKYMRGARLVGVEQPPFERILYLQFTGPLQPTTLALELLGTRSNLILLGPQQIILGVARLPKANVRPGQRLILPNQPYQPPPPQDKLRPDELTEYTLRRELDEASPNMPLARLLPQVVAGVSPLLAREVVFRATGSAKTPVSKIRQLSPLLDVFHALFDRLETGDWQPSLAMDDSGAPQAFAPYPLTHLPRTQSVATLSEAVEIYFADAAAGYAAAKAPLQQAIDQARQRLDRRRQKLEEDAAAQANPDALKEYGEMILACAHQIVPGQTELLVDWLPGESPTRVVLDSSLSAAENAQQYFSRYRKAQRAGQEIPTQLKKIDQESRYLDQIEQDLSMAENRPEIDAVAAALADAGHTRARQGKKKQKQQAAGNYLRLTAPDGATVWVGKNSLQNAHLTFNRAKSDDLWLHARGVPGAHVIIPTAQGLPTEDDVLWAAGVAAWYSKARHDTAVDVDVTVKKYVRAIKGAPPGMVTLRNESTLHVSPFAPDND